MASGLNSRKLLMLVPCDIFPPVHGGSTRVRFTIKHLLKTNQLNVLVNHVYSVGGKIELIHPNLSVRYCPKTTLDALGYRSVLFNPFYVKQAHYLMRNTSSDIIQCELLWSAPSGILLKKKFKRPLVLVDHNVEYLKFKEAGKFVYSLLLRTIEKKCCEQADKIVVVSELDRDNLSILYDIPKEKIQVIRNCTDSDKFKYTQKGRNYVRQKYGIDNETIVITFVGKLDYTPNVSAVKYIAGKIYPVILKDHPKTKFLIVGANYKPLMNYQKKNIIFTGYVNNLADYLSASDIVIIPIDSGSGTRIKTLEAASCSRPVVSTKKGTEGQDFRDKKEMMITDSVDQHFIECIKELIEDEHMRETLGKNARQKIENQYDWKQEIKKFEEVYEEVL